MKPYTYKSSKRPPCNGRPQLWMCERAGRITKLRIIYSRGKVEYFFNHYDSENYEYWNPGCTSSYGQKEAVENCLQYSWGDGEKTYFLGYL